MVHALRDGTRVLLRPIEPADKDRLTVALGRLSEEAIRRRFLAAKPHFSSGELSYLTEIDGHDHIAIVAVLADAARAAGIRRFAATMLSDNAAVRRLMDTITERLEQERVGGGLRDVLIDLAA